MATLWDKLNEVYPRVLSPEPSRAINGTQLLQQLPPELIQEYAENSFRQHFSEMSKDPLTKIAKVSDGHGYYLRCSESEIQQAPLPDQSPQGNTEAPHLGRETQLEEKFRSILIRHAEQVNQDFPVHVEHTRSTRKEAGVNRWKFPDVVLLRWEVGKLKDDGYKLDQHLLAVKSSLGEPPFKLQSAELKVSLNLSSFRESFFQCVSNSKWAHRSILAVAASVEDKTLRDELERLGASYDVTILTYGLNEQILESFPDASDILKMTAADFEQQVTSSINLTRISTAKERPTLDWEHINDLRSINGDFSDIFEWIARCLVDKKAYTFNDFVQMREIQKKA